MAKTELSLQTLPQFDFGRASAAFNEALSLVARDCLDRPTLPKARKITLEVSIEPGHAESGELDELQVGFAVTTRMPAKSTRAKPLGINKQGHLFFNPDAPDNPAQTTFDLDKGD